jgi:hypothetical protein
MAAVAAGADAAATYSTPAAAAVYAATAALADPGQGEPAPGAPPRQPAVTALHAACQARTATPVTVTALGTGPKGGGPMLDRHGALLRHPLLRAR